MDMNNMINDFGLIARGMNIPRTTIDAYVQHTNAYVNPTIIEERKLNVASMDVFSRLMMDRIIWLPTAIDSDVANIISAQMLCLESSNNEAPISLYINSPGGSVTDGMQIYDVMNLISCPVETICAGTAASMAAVLLSSGTKGKRFSLPHSQVMIHQPSGGTGHVQASDMRIAWSEMEKCQRMLYEVLSENTGKPYDEIAAACDRDNWFTAQEAVDFGLIDSIIKKK